MGGFLDSISGKKNCKHKGHGRIMTNSWGAQQAGMLGFGDRMNDGQVTLTDSEGLMW